MGKTTKSRLQKWSVTAGYLLVIAAMTASTYRAGEWALSSFRSHESSIAAIESAKAATAANTQAIDSLKANQQTTCERLAKIDGKLDTVLLLLQGTNPANTVANMTDMGKGD